jgi:hypothetical protein
MSCDISIVLLSTEIELLLIFKRGLCHGQHAIAGISYAVATFLLDDGELPEILGAPLSSRTAGSETATFNVPGGHDLDKEPVVDLRPGPEELRRHL